MKTLRSAAIVLGCLMVAVFAAPQYTNPSDPYLGNNKLGMCYNHTANNWINVANTPGNYTNYALQCDALGILNTPTAGTVTAIGVTTANGVSGTSSGGATPNLTITLGAITPTSVNGVPAASAVSSTAPTANHAACIKSAGPPIVIGTCSTVVASDGTCTCG